MIHLSGTWTYAQLIIDIIECSWRQEVAILQLRVKTNFQEQSVRELVHSTRHMEKIEEILEGCGFPRLRFKNQSNWISAMLLPGETPLAGCIGRQYSPPPEHDFPMLILATDLRIVAFVSNTDVDNNLPTLAPGHPYNLIDQIHFYECGRADGEVRIRYKNNRRVVIYSKVVSPLNLMMAQISRLDFGMNVHRLEKPMEEVFSWKERFQNRSWRWCKAVDRFLALPRLTVSLNIILALAVIAQAVALFTQ